MKGDCKNKLVFEYGNYREFIRDFYVFSKSNNKKFSHRVFARLAGFKSSNFIKFIIDNKSNISAESAERLAKAMKLSVAESAFFINLYSFKSGEKRGRKVALCSRIIKPKNLAQNLSLREALFNYTSKWYLSVLRGLVGLPGFDEDITGSQEIFSRP